MKLPKCEALTDSMKQQIIENFLGVHGQKYGTPTNARIVGQKHGCYIPYSMAQKVLNENGLYRTPQESKLARPTCKLKGIKKEYV